MNTLEISHLNKNYGTRQVLFDVNFTIPEGKIIGLIGPNGAGKSTIMKTIVGLTNYQKGAIKINGLNLTPNHRKALKNVGTMIETPALYENLTGYEHLKLFNEGPFDKKAIDAIAKETQIDKFMNRKAKKYSLGMKQRLGIAMTLVNQPKLLILDEPMNGLDPQSTHDLRDLLLKLAHRGISILISSHLLDELARIADYYVVINHGHVITQANAGDFLSDKQQTIQIETENNEKAINLLQNADLDAHLNDRQIEISQSEDHLNQALTELVNNQIKIKAVNTQHADLEETLLRTLKQNNQEES